MANFSWQSIQWDKTENYLTQCLLTHLSLLVTFQQATMMSVNQFPKYDWSPEHYDQYTT